MISFVRRRRYPFFGGPTYAAVFKASNSEYLDITDAAQTGLNPAGTFSIYGWFNMESYGAALNANFIICKSAAAGVRQYQVFVYEDNQKLFFRVSPDGTALTAVIANNAGPLSLNTWYLFECTHSNGVGLGVRVFGAASSTQDVQAHVTGVHSAAGRCYVGSVNGSANFFDGQMAYLAFYGGAAPVELGAQLARMGPDITGGDLSAGQKTALTTLWDFEEPSGIRTDFQGPNDLTEYNSVDRVSVVYP